MLLNFQQTEILSWWMMNQSAKDTEKMLKRKKHWRWVSPIHSSAKFGQLSHIGRSPSLVGTNVGKKFGTSKSFAYFCGIVLALRMYPLREAKQVSFSGLSEGEGFALNFRIWHTLKFESEDSITATWHQQKNTMPGYLVRRNVRTTSTCPRPSKTGCCIVVLLGKMNNCECKKW